MDRNAVEERPEQQDAPRQCGQSCRSADRSGTPAAKRCDGENDRKSLDDLDDRGKERRAHRRRSHGPSRHRISFSRKCQTSAIAQIWLANVDVSNALISRMHALTECVRIAEGEYMNLATFDLNLLLVFEAILRERSVT